MNQIGSLKELLADYLRKGHDDFVRGLDSPVLLFREHLGMIDTWDDFVTMPSKAGAVGPRSPGNPAPSSEGPADDSPTVLRVAKAPGNPWASRISLGRAGNNDLVVPHGSVSKLHAHFTPDPTGSYQLTDVNSQNGSRLNGVPLPAGELRPIKAGDELAFGDVVATFHSPASFGEYLAKLSSK